MLNRKKNIPSAVGKQEGHKMDGGDHAAGREGENSLSLWRKHAYEGHHDGE